jgi:hypothetical protein
MTQLQDNRCFGRVKAQELTEEEMALVGGGDVFHSRWCPNEVYGGGGQEEGCLGCVYT